MKNSITKTIKNLLPNSFLLTCTFILIAISSFAQLGWVQVPSPDPSHTRNMVRGISGTSSSDVWAVGSYEAPQYRHNDLLLHWNGSVWQQFPPLYLSTTLDDLRDVEAIATNDVWAVGAYNNFATTRAEIIHYDGTAWTNHPVPLITGGSWLDAIHAVSPTDIWAVGGKSGSPFRPPYVMHYNGSSWTEMIVPSNVFRSYFVDVDGISNDIWAVGHWGVAYGDYHALAMHWDGSNWSNISLPSSVVTPLSEILSVKMIAPNDVWAVGYYLTGGGFNIHWDGSTWTEITPFTGGGAYAPLSTNNIFSVGGEISHWNGTTWTVVDSLLQLSDPSLGSAVVFANGEIWAGGRTVDASGNFFSLIYRSVNNTPLFTGGTTQSWNVSSNSNNNSPGILFLTTDADVSQILTYTIITAPTHGTLNGLPATAITNNGSALPTGISYTPVPGYVGTDQFVIRVAAGPVMSQTTINLNVGVALPVLLTNFQVSKQGANALLTWKTASESNTYKFEVEHSIDGIHFATAGSVNAQGSSSIDHFYTFIHLSPLPGQNYYRLKLIDLDGKTTFLPVKTLLFDAGMLAPIILLSNPVINNNIHVQVNAKGLVQFNFYNLQGQKLLTRNITNTASGSRYFINLPQAETGIYILEATINQQRYTLKLLLQ